ncbi:hypothetical protein BU15DRAFT_64251 [Melanogaster broomeanus]|nr:hypothetical protein BU15DRAFT_64251 [Melanogaster broomeanus]
MSDLAPATSATKHKCLPSEACIIHLSDIGQCFHTFLKDTFHARFSPPALPSHVRRYCATHPLYWLWTTKSGSNAGKTFRVPTIPTHCPKGSPKAVSWMVNVFHSFKAHLRPSVLIDGNVPTPILHTYQSNMKSNNVLLQQDAPTPTQILETTILRSPSHPSPPTPTPTQTPTNSTKSDLDTMMALSAISQIEALKKEIAELHSHTQATSATSGSSQAVTSTPLRASANPFTIAAGLASTVPHPPCTQPSRRARAKGTTGPSGPTHLSG